MRAIYLALTYFFVLSFSFTASSFAKLDADYEQMTISIERVEGSTIYSQEGVIFSCTDKKLQKELQDRVRVQYISLGSQKIIIAVKKAISEAFPPKNRSIYIPSASK